MSTPPTVPGRPPLAGLRVLEMGQLIAGPFCGQLLGDLGAEVIKIELPAGGDPMREWGRGLAVWWPIIARNKKCITLDVRSERGLQIARRLAAVSDVVLENFRPGTMEKWGLGWTELSAINSKIVMVRVSGFGQDGPYAGRAGYGGIGEAMGGLRQVCGDPGTPPSRVGISIGDSLAAMFACIGCLAALRHRDATGRGQVVDSAIYESVLGVMESTIPEFTEGGHVRERTGSILPGLAPSNVYPTSDGRMVLIGANQDTVFRRLCDAMGRPELSADSRFATHRARGDHQQALDEIVAGWSVTLAEEGLLELLETHGVPAGRIFRAPDMLSDPQYVARRSILRVPHPEFENLWMQNVFPRLSETAGTIRWPGPAMGAHNEEIYGGLLGMGASERRELAVAGVI